MIKSTTHSQSHVSITRLPSTQVLFLQGGASTIFSAIPMNLAPDGGVSDHIVTGAASPWTPPPRVSIVWSFFHLCVIFTVKPLPSFHTK